jgi:hypothetical protein
VGGQIRIGVLTALVVAVLGVPVGLLWVAAAPRTTYLIAGGRALLADPETQTLIAADGWFAVLTAVAGLLCGVAGYILAGRLGELSLLPGLAAGGIAAAIASWRLGHLIGAPAFHHLLRTARDGTAAKGVLDLHAVGVVVAWPLAAVVAFGLLEALDLAGRESRGRLPAGDPGGGRAGQPDQIGGGQFDLEAAPTSRDVDRREA